MKRTILGAAALAFAFSTAGAIAQTKPSPPPVPGPEQRWPEANPITPGPHPSDAMAAPATTGSVERRLPRPAPDASGSQVTAPETYPDTTPQYTTPQ
ncbi:hypothetical protein [Microvirga roseola]|uniref:hypothetical protein n=1 Tax=Microvirga roseola TaxID=2883126 RepID=UPI001E462384|nr:hypothetical protein [Microvirga roseola]